MRATPAVRQLGEGARRRPRRAARAPGRAVGSRKSTSARRRAASGDTRIPIRGIRRAIVEQVSRAHREIPAVTFVEECDFTDVDVALLVPLAIHASARALGEHPELNARFEGESIVLHDRVDVGIAVQTDGGPRRPGRARLRASLRRGDRRRGAAARRRRARGQPRRRGAPRLDVHRDERGQARRAARDAADQLPGGRDPRPPPHRRAAGRLGTARSSSAAWATSR